MKRNKKIIEFDGIVFDSNEELEFYHWVCEAKKYNFISEWSYNDQSYELSPKKTVLKEKKLKTKNKTIESHLFHAHSYKPDFIFTKGSRWGLIEESINLFSLHNNIEFVIDVKGTFQRHDGSRSFSINQKWMYEKYNIYVNKVIPEKFFPITWIPEKCKTTPKTNQIREKYKKIPTLFEKFGKISPDSKIIVS